MRAPLAAGALLLATAAFAAEPLKPLKSLDGFMGWAHTGRWGTTVSKAVVGVWDLKAQRQVAAIDIPVEPNRVVEADGEQTELNAPAITADGRFLLVTAYTTYWRIVGGEWESKSSSKLYLVSVPEARIVKTIAEVKKGACDRNYGILPYCPRFNNAEFSPDGTKIFADMRVEADWKKTKDSKPEYYEGKLLSWMTVVHKSRYELIATDLSGKVLSRHAYSGVRDDSQQGSDWIYTPGEPAGGFLADGRPVLFFADGAGCRVKDFEGKQISFLADCSPARKPAFREGRAWSTTGGFTVWDPATGSVLSDAGREPKPPFAVSLDGTGWVEAVYAPKASTAAVTVFDAATGKPVLERVLSVVPGWAPEYAQYDRAGDRFVTRSFDEKYNSTYATYALGAVQAAPAAAPVAEAPTAAGPDIDTPPATKTKTDPDAVAVVIGIEKYRQEGIPAVDFAERDARAMHGYLTRSMGFDAKNTMLLTNERASKTDLEKFLGRWLLNRVTAKSRVFVYYAGHGSPNPTTGDAYLMPYEADPAYLEETALPLSRVYAALEKLPTKDVTVVLDACFSGQGGRSLIAAGTRPLVAVKETKAGGNSVVLAAAGAGQISASDPSRRHGLLTASLLEALHGAADADGDGRVTAAEAFEFVRPAVERAARLQNVEQTPTFSGKAAGSRAWIDLK